ncbi:MAG TPA: OmpA family protein [Myxococcota bacterium]|nr:OmpA family protein [Myxococcota bacterium]
MRTQALALALLAVTVAPSAAQEGADDERAVSCLGVGRLRGTIYDSETGTLQPGLDAILDAMAKAYREKCSGRLVIIQGHAYELPTPALNEELSELRALTVQHELVKRGIPLANLIAVGRGDTLPLAPATEPEAMRLNRRITFRVAD